MTLLNKKFASLLTIIGVITLTLQLSLTISRQVELGHSLLYGLFIYLGYFTILTNILCVLVAASHSPKFADNLGLVWLRKPWVVTTAATSILNVGIAYHLLLSQKFNPIGLHYLTNIFHHYILPILFIYFWWHSVPRGALYWQDLGRIVIYPISYLLYLIIRGELTGLYPYFFLNVSQIGYTETLRNVVGITLASSVTIVFMMALKIKRKLPALNTAVVP